MCRVRTCTRPRPRSRERGPRGASRRSGGFVHFGVSQNARGCVRILRSSMERANNREKSHVPTLAHLVLHAAECAAPSPSLPSSSSSPPAPTPRSWCRTPRTPGPTRGPMSPLRRTAAKRRRAPRTAARTSRSPIPAPTPGTTTLDRTRTRRSTRATPGSTRATRGSMRATAGASSTAAPATTPARRPCSS